MPKNALFIVCSVLLFSVPMLGGQTPEGAPTFSGDVAPVLYENCVGCHRPGEMAPMSLVTYEEARPWARSIREEILRGSMPPWHAEAPAGTFLNERYLTDDERATIVRWVEAGAPEGERDSLPPVPEFPTGWTIGTPDAVVTMPVEFEIPSAGEIPYQYFRAQTGFSEDKWVQAIEIRPGEPSVVHHVLVYSRAPGEESEAPVFLPANFGRPRQVRRRSDNRGDLIATTAPGTNAQVFPTGQALLIPAASVLTFQVHYTSNGTPVTDRTRVGFVFADEPPQQEVRVDAFVNATFAIPSGASNHRVDSAIEFVRDARILAIFPHTHLRGKSWEYRMVYPDGRSEVVLSIPDYDFNWQTYYEFAEPLGAPTGSRLEGTAYYDNSAANPDNPDPDIDVRWGDQTWEEMQYTGISLVVEDADNARAQP